MKYVLLLAMVVMTGCSGAQYKLWFMGWDEERATRNCQASTPKGVKKYESQIARAASEEWLNTFQKTYASLPTGRARWEYLESVKAEREALDKEQARWSRDNTMRFFPYPPEQIEQAIKRCVAQNRSLALSTTVPVVFTVPLVQ